jgi:hypothetical protein
MLDGFKYRIFSNIEVVKILDISRLGPIYTTLVVIKDRSWCACVMHLQVADDMTDMLGYSSGHPSIYYNGTQNLLFRNLQSLDH